MSAYRLFLVMVIGYLLYGAVTIASSDADLRS
jgi:hypothetical protein